MRIGHPQLASVKQDFSLEPTLSILLPCFNEGPDVYNSIRTILECDYPVDKFQVIAPDDRSRDDSWEWLQKAAADFPRRVVARRNAKNRGKSRSLIGASRVADAEIILVMGSDCIFAKDTIRQLGSC